MSRRWQRCTPNFVRPGSPPRTATRFPRTSRRLFEHDLCAPRNGANHTLVHDVQGGGQEAGADVLSTGNMGNLTFSYHGRGMLQDLLRRARLVRSARNSGTAARSASCRCCALHGIGPLPFLPAGLLAAIRRRFGKLEIAVRYLVTAQCRVRRRTWLSKPCAQLGSIRIFSVSVLDFRTRSLKCGKRAGDMSYARRSTARYSSRDPTRYRALLEYCFAI